MLDDEPGFTGTRRTHHQYGSERIDEVDPGFPVLTF